MRLTGVRVILTLVKMKMPFDRDILFCKNAPDKRNHIIYYILKAVPF